jgi:HlyD family secretion protein
MQLKNNKLFRQEALDQLSSPEQLDQVMQVVRPPAWLPLSAMGVLVAVAGIWSVFGRIPLTVTGEGIVISPPQIKSAQPNSKLVSVVYFANEDGKQIQAGMQAQVTPSFAKRERDGGIVGVIANVSSFPVTTQDITALVGNAEIAASLAGRGRIQAFVQLQEDSSTVSGYKWSSSDGPPLKLTSGTTTSVRVKIGETAPISYIIPMLRSWTGVY